MHPSLSTSYIIPAIILNPVLFLHGLNTIFSRTLPPIAVVGPIQRSPYTMYGPAAVRQHVDVQSSENLCWGYTVIMIVEQLLAYGQVNQRRVERRESRGQRDEVAKVGATQRPRGVSNIFESKRSTVCRTPSQMSGTGTGHHGKRRLETIEEDAQCDSSTVN